MTDRMIAWAIGLVVLAGLAVAMAFVLPWWGVALLVAFGLAWYATIFG